MTWTAARSASTPTGMTTQLERLGEHLLKLHLLGLTAIAFDRAGEDATGDADPGVPQPSGVRDHGADFWTGPEHPDGRIGDEGWTSTRGAVVVLAFMLLLSGSGVRMHPTPVGDTRGGQKARAGEAGGGSPGLHGAQRRKVGGTGSRGAERARMPGARGWLLSPKRERDAAVN